jgi:hypothetical protein
MHRRRKVLAKLSWVTRDAGRSTQGPSPYEIVFDLKQSSTLHFTLVPDKEMGNIACLQKKADTISLAKRVAMIKKTLSTRQNGDKYSMVG